MYKQKGIVKNVPLDILISEEVFFYKEGNKIIRNTFNSIKQSIFESDKPFFLEKIDDKSMIISLEKNIIVFNKKGDVISNIPTNFQGFIQIKVIENDICVVRNVVNGIWDVKCINKNGELIFSIPLSYPLSCFIVSTRIIFFSGEDKSILCYDYIESQKIVWRIDITELFGSENVNLLGEVLEFENKLYFYLSENFKASGIYCVDAETGKLLYKTNQIGGYLKLANERFYMVNDDYFITELNPRTFEYKRTDFTFLLKPLGLNLGRSNKEVIIDNLFYFVSESGRSDNAVVGILDLESKKLVWQTDIPIEEGSFWIYQIQVYKDRLFVLTQGGTLHIFEKEKPV